MGLFGRSRGETKAANTPGYITEKMSVRLTKSALGTGSAKDSRNYRSVALEEISKHLDDRAYDHLQDWHKASRGEEYVSIRERKPFMRLNVPKMICTRLTSKLIGKEVFPELIVEDDPDSQYYFRSIMKAAGLGSKLNAAIRSWCALGSTYVRFSIMGSKIKLQHYNSNNCYPQFSDDGDLEMVRVQYTYTDNDDLDDKGNPIKKWYKAEFSKMSDILYDNPIWKAGEEPDFTVAQQVDHGFGFVQGEWMRTSEEDLSTPDGLSLVEDAISFLDAMNYSLSLTQEAVDYNTSPQLGLNGMEDDEIENLIKSSTKAWNLGRDGKGGFIEGTMNGVTVSMELRAKNRLFIQDMTRVILLDPEKITSTAQSGKAMEVLHGPMVDLINELRPQLETHLLSLVMKIGVANLLLARAAKGDPAIVAPVNVPPGWVPQSLNLTLNWPAVFPMTVQDMKNFTDWVISASNNNIISRKTAVRKVAKYFDIEDVEAEIAEIENQKSLNPFGMF